MANLVEYDEKFIEACFRAWYDAGSPRLRNSNGAISVGGSQVMKFIPTAPDGRKPTLMTIKNWMERYGWYARADALDAEVSIRLDREAIEKRIEILKELAETGKTLMDKGVEFILSSENPFQDNPSAAVRAIVAGSEMRFKYAGQADRLTAINQMSDKQLEKEAMRLLGKPVEDEDAIEGETEDINDDSESDDNS